MISEKKRYGIKGEKLALKYLKKIGYRIINTNYTTKLGEIDIIAKDKDCIVFVEVKRRSDISFGVPSQNVDYNKRKKIVGVAMNYIQSNNINEMVRFDVVEVIDKEINHIIGAFYA